ncbi:MAG: cupin domain-containing protein [Chromatiales bacterium]|nr:cupin domain-containing protein [Gammaproteobacteria bacterium]MCP5352986.1 cupin domain-containing protein [Chromatiales bacterium]
MLSARVLIAVVILAAAAQSAADSGPWTGVGLPEWTEPELAMPIAVRTVGRSEFSSAHLIRLAGAEEPHFHDRHDLAITVLRGRSVLHFSTHDVELGAGDTAFIPRGHYHWAENVGDEASVVFAVFAPSFDGQDRRPADGAAR